MIFDLIFTSNLYFYSFLGIIEIRFGSEKYSKFSPCFSTDAKTLLFYFFIFILFWGVTQKLGDDNEGYFIVDQIHN